MIHDSIAYRYEIISQLGRGSFGRVFRAFDHKKKGVCCFEAHKMPKKVSRAGQGRNRYPPNSHFERS